MYVIVVLDRKWKVIVNIKKVCYLKNEFRR